MGFFVAVVVVVVVVVVVAAIFVLSRVEELEMLYVPKRACSVQGGRKKERRKERKKERKKTCPTLTPSNRHWSHVASLLVRRPSSDVCEWSDGSCLARPTTTTLLSLGE